MPALQTSRCRAGRYQGDSENKHIGQSYSFKAKIAAARGLESRARCATDEGGAGLLHFLRGE